MKKHHVIVLLLLCSMWRVSAQTTYSVQSIPYSLSPLGQRAVLIGTDDRFTSAINLPFTFEYFGVPYTQVILGSNGVVSFDLNKADSLNQWQIAGGIPGNVELKNAIACPYHDIDGSISGFLQYGFYGVAPYRRMVVSWVDIPMFSCSQLIANSQVVLYESYNNIDINIGNKPLCTSWNAGVAIVGIEDSLGFGYTAPNRNYPTQWTASQESWRFCPNNNCLPSANYAIKGRAYVDSDTNCQQDFNESSIPNLIVMADNTPFLTNTDANGNYTLMVDSGTYVIRQNNTATHNVLPCNGSTTHTVTVGGVIDSVTHINFANNYIPPCPNKYVDLMVNSLPRCSETYATLRYGNYGLGSDSNVIVTLHLPDSISLVSATPALTELGNGNYSYAHNGVLEPFTSNLINLTLNIGCDTVGTTYCMNAAISGAGSDCDTLNNSESQCIQLSAALPPNSVATLPNSSLDISVYPNPFSTSTLFHIGAYQNPLQFSLIDAMGRIVKTAAINSANYTLNSDGLAKGIYFWRIIDQNGMPTTGRVVVQD